jgi:hypothetical protein
VRVRELLQRPEREGAEMTTVRELKERLVGLDDDLPIYIMDKGYNHNLHVFKWIGSSEYYTISGDT